MSKLCGWNEILSSGQVVNLLGVTVPRFVGTSSEPGYLAAFLPMLLYYFIKSNINHRFLYIAITGLMILSTFSAAVYIAAAAVLCIVVMGNGLKKKHLATVSCIIIICVLLYLFNSVIQDLINNMIFDKVESMLSGDQSNYSATERNQHIGHAIQMFGLSTFMQKLIGLGTGGYLYNTFHFGTDLYSYEVEEAYNLYLSTLVDRGIIGFSLLVMLLVNLW